MGGVGPDRELLESMRLEVEEVTGGCCGLAGSWGFEADHYTLVVANGFSCKTQVEHGAGLRALHLAEVLKLARDGELVKQPAPSPARRARRAAALAVGARWRRARERSRSGAPGEARRSFYWMGA